jgi:hypothetical protein
MSKSEVMQSVQNAFPEIYEPNDPDLSLIFDFSEFRTDTLLVMNDFFKDLKNYGLFSQMPTELLRQYHERFNYFLKQYNGLQDSLEKKISTVKKNIEKHRKEDGPDSFPEWLNTKVLNRTLGKLYYYDYICDLDGYVQYFFSKKVC